VRNGALPRSVQEATVAPYDDPDHEVRAAARDRLPAEAS
jgi:hypothetical protein